jgi:hypothetical protein
MSFVLVALVCVLLSNYIVYRYALARGINVGKETISAILKKSPKQKQKQKQKRHRSVDPTVITLPATKPRLYHCPGGKTCIYKDTCYFYHENLDCKEFLTTGKCSNSAKCTKRMLPANYTRHAALDDRLEQYLIEMNLKETCEIDSAHTVLILQRDQYVNYARYVNVLSSEIESVKSLFLQLDDTIQRFKKYHTTLSNSVVNAVD